jgi:hypothetical protein
MNFLSGPRFLAIYSGTLTIAFAVVVLCGAAMVRNSTFGIITARRINIVEPDGTVRLTLSNQADFPGAWNRHKEYPRLDRTEAAGLLFMSEEGTEQGGLIWGASQLPDGTIESHGHLSLDQYEENQVFAIDAGQEGRSKFSQITIADQDITRSWRSAVPTRRSRNSQRTSRMRPGASSSRLTRTTENDSSWDVHRMAPLASILATPMGRSGSH